MEVLATTEYPKCITNAISDLKDAIGRIENWVEDVRLYETMIEHFKDLAGLISCHLSVDRFGVDITFTIDDMRRIAPIRLWLREHEHPAPTIIDYPVSQQRVFTYYLPAHADLYLCAQLPYKEGAICKYVKVGTKQEPVYELQCEGKVLKEEENEK